MYKIWIVKWVKISQFLDKLLIIRYINAARASSLHPSLFGCLLLGNWPLLWLCRPLLFSGLEMREGVVIMVPVNVHVVHNHLSYICQVLSTKWRWIYHPPMHNGDFCGVLPKGVRFACLGPLCTDAVRVWKLSIIFILRMICDFQEVFT